MIEGEGKVKEPLFSISFSWDYKSMELIAILLGHLAQSFFKLEDQYVIEF